MTPREPRMPAEQRQAESETALGPCLRRPTADGNPNQIDDPQVTRALSLRFELHPTASRRIVRTRAEWRTPHLGKHRYLARSMPGSTSVPRGNMAAMVSTYLTTGRGGRSSLLTEKRRRPSARTRVPSRKIKHGAHISK